MPDPGRAPARSSASDALFSQGASLPKPLDVLKTVFGHEGFRGQ